MKLSRQTIIGLGLFALMGGLPTVIYAQKPPNLTEGGGRTCLSLLGMGMNRRRPFFDSS
ncbi:MAG: hypothetical protein KME08_03830 [Aphanothece sp. CMT-3BRIN-NPC111]|jgi:hypothetical protein|nr:hypothetical protein [Aphanothece sp. CMT-3BRIN-NPC111]